MKRIISHPPPRHLDDWLSIIILRYVENIELIEYISEINQDILDDVNTFVVDIGNVYDPNKNNFDHHQDIFIPSSVIQIVYKYNIKSSDALYTIDMLDRFGPKFARINDNINQLRKIILGVDPKCLEKKDIEYIYKSFVNTKDNNYNDFMKLFTDKLLYLKCFRDSKDNLILLENDMRNKLNNSIIIIDKFKFIFSTESLSPYHYDIFQETAADIIIERNNRNPSQTSVIKNCNSKWYDLLNLRKLPYEKSFVHANGFMCVVNIDVDSIDKNEIIDFFKSF